MDVRSADAGAGRPSEFSCFTTSDCARVWSVLTNPGLTSDFLYGLSLRSTWQPGAPLDAYYEDRLELSGQVLCLRPGERLSYLLRSGEGDPAVYLTWLLRPTRGGTVLTLHVDGADESGPRADAEDVWLPVLAAVQRMLDQ